MVKLQLILKRLSLLARHINPENQYFWENYQKCNMLHKNIFSNESKSEYQVLDQTRSQLSNNSDLSRLFRMENMIKCLILKKSVWTKFLGFPCAFKTFYQKCKMQCPSRFRLDVHFGVTFAKNMRPRTHSKGP